MIDIQGLKKQTKYIKFTYADKNNGALDVVLEWTPGAELYGYTEEFDFDLSKEQVDDLVNLVAKEAYKMGKDEE